MYWKELAGFLEQLKGEKGFFDWYKALE